MAADGGSRVLIADSEPVLRQQLYNRLLDGGVFSDAVPNGEAALETLRKRPYSVVLLDPTLPPAGAADDILALISQLPTRERPVVLILAPPGATKAFDVDLVQVVLRKPCDVRQLVEIIRSCVRVSAEHPRPRSSQAQTSRLTAADNSSG